MYQPPTTLWKGSISAANTCGVRTGRHAEAERKKRWRQLGATRERGGGGAGEKVGAFVVRLAEGKRARTFDMFALSFHARASVLRKPSREDPPSAILCCSPPEISSPARAGLRACPTEIRPRLGERREFPKIRRVSTKSECRTTAPAAGTGAATGTRSIERRGRIRRSWAPAHRAR